MGLKRKVAAFTIVQNESRFLHVWASYYKSQLGKENVFILDHDTDHFGAVGDLDQERIGLSGTRGANVVPVHRAESFSHGWLRDTVQAFQRFLLQSYEWVLFAEADEIIAPRRPGYLLGKYVDDLLADGRSQLIQCQGYEVVHQKDSEPDLDWQEKPLLRQRSFWSPSLLYSKVLLSRMPVAWGLGFHELTDPRSHPPEVYDRVAADVDTGSGLSLLHLHRIDWKSCLEKNREQRGRKWDQADLAANRGAQNRLVEEQALEEWFYHPERYGQEALRLEPIPESMKEVV